MTPELLIPHLLLEMCNDRLVAVVDADDGTNGRWLLGLDQPNERLNEILNTVDPVVILLALCGWRTVAVEFWSKDGNDVIVERIELLASSTCRQSGSDEAAWHVPVFRGSADRAVDGQWEVRFELTSHPIMDAEQLLPVDDIANTRYGDAWGDGRHVTVSVSSPGEYGPVALYNLLVEDAGSLARSLAGLLGTAASRFGTRFEDITAETATPAPTGLLGGFVPSKWSLDVPDLASLTAALQAQSAPFTAYMSDVLIGAGISSGDREAFFLAQATQGSEAAFTGPIDARASLAAPISELRNLSCDVCLDVAPMLTEYGRQREIGPWAHWFDTYALGLCSWFRLHNEGVLDILQAVSIGVRTEAHAVLDSGRNYAELSQRERAMLTALLRRFPSDPRAQEAAGMVLPFSGFGGFWVGIMTGTLAQAKELVRDAIAATPLFYGHWEVVSTVGVLDDGMAPHDLLVLPHPDVAPLAFGFHDWVLGDHFQLVERLTERRGYLLEIQLPAGAFVIPEEWVTSSTDYQLMPTPRSVLDAIALDPDTIGYDGDQVVVGHPDTGVYRPEDPSGVPVDIHTAIARQLQIDATIPHEAGGFPNRWPHHGTTTASALLGQGTFPGNDPLTGRTESFLMRGVAPGAFAIPYEVSQSVVLLALGSLADAIRYYSVPSPDDPSLPRAQVISISLGFKHDWTMAISKAVAAELHLPAKLPIALINATFENLRQACLAAESAGIIICAASGQLLPGIPGEKLGSVAYPAAFDTVVGCGGLTGDLLPWYDALRGPGVDVAVPCVGAWGARWDENANEIVMQSEGTSYAAPVTAGVAALWLQKRGAGIRAGGRNPAEVFRQVLQGCGLDPVVDRDGTPVPGYGHGILHATRILTHPV